MDNSQEKPPQGVVEQTEVVDKPKSVLDKRVERAHISITTHQQDLIAAGVTQDQIQQAATNAESRIRSEYEEADREDPLRRLERAVSEVAETPAEKESAQQHQYYMEHYRKVLQEGGLLNNDPNLALQIVGPLTLMKENDMAGIPSDEFRERILRKLDILDPDQTLDDFQRDAWQSPQLVNEPPYREAFVKDLPTTISGVTAEVDLGGNNAIRVRMAPDTLARVKSFQP